MSVRGALSALSKATISAGDASKEVSAPADKLTSVWTSLKASFVGLVGDKAKGAAGSATGFIGSTIIGAVTALEASDKAKKTWTGTVQLTDFLADLRSLVQDLEQEADAYFTGKGSPGYRALKDHHDGLSDDDARQDYLRKLSAQTDQVRNTRHYVETFEEKIYYAWFRANEGRIVPGQEFSGTIDLVIKLLMRRGGERAQLTTERAVVRAPGAAGMVRRLARIAPSARLGDLPIQKCILVNPFDDGMLYEKPRLNRSAYGVYDAGNALVTRDVMYVGSKLHESDVWPVIAWAADASIHDGLNHIPFRWADTKGQNT